MDKQNGHLTYLMYDESDTQAPINNLISYDMKDKIKHIKKVVKQKAPPEVCYEAVPEGKSGNMKLLWVVRTVLTRKPVGPTSELSCTPQVHVT